MKNTVWFAAVSLQLLLLVSVASADETPPKPDRQMVITVDDLPAQRISGLPEARVARLTDQLVDLFERREVPAIGFVNEVKLEVDEKVQPVRVGYLEQWLDAGLELGNHSYSHPSLHRTPLDEYQQDVLRGERITRPLAEKRSMPWRYFRHPYLHTGLDLDTKRGLEAFLHEHGYRVAPVTVDNSEWIFARAYDAALDREDDELRQRVGAAYVDYMMSMVEYYEGQSRALFEREIPQTLLIHANALNGEYLSRLLDRIEARGYGFIDLDTALEDPAYASEDTYTGRGGITWLHCWAITRRADPSMFRGEPRTPEWVQEVAGIEE